MNLKQLSGWREWAIISALSALIIAIVFCPAIFQGKLIYSEDGGGSDSLDLNIPRRHLAVQSLVQYGEFPLWEPKIACGAPLFAEGEAGVLYPSILFYLHPNLTTATNLTIFSAIFIAMIGSYAFGRSLGVSPPASLIAACAYGLGESFILRTNGLNIIHAIAWLPASLAAIQKAFLTDKKRYWLALTAIWTLQMLAGHFQMAIICQMGCWAYMVWLLLSQRSTLGCSWYKALGQALLALAFTASLSSIQLLTTYELSQQSTRNAVIPLETLDRQAYKLPHLLNLLNPLHNSRMVNASPDYPPYRLLLNFRELSQYIGLLPLLLVPLAFSAKHRHSALGLALISVVFAIIALGPRYHLYYVLWRYFPQMNHFRLPCRFTIVVASCLAALAALGAQNLYEYLQSKMSAKWSQILIGAILLITIADLTRVNSLFQGYLPGDWQQKPATIGEISSPQRIYSPLYTNIWWNNLSNLEQMERTRPIWQHRSLLGSELSTIWGVETADDYIVHGGGVSLSHSASLQQACANLLVACHKDGAEVSEVVASLADWLRIQSISHIVSPSKFPEFWPTSMFERCQEVAIPEIPQEPIFVYTLAQPLEKLRLVPALQKTIPTGTVNLERYLGLQDVDSLYETNFHNPPEIGKVQLISATNHTVLAETECPQDAHLVISNTYDKNWQAFIDDGPATAVRCTNLSLQSLAVPAGHHRIRLQYISPAFELGWKVSLAALLALLGLAGISVAKQRF